MNIASKTNAKNCSGSTINGSYKSNIFKNYLHQNIETDLEMNI